MNADVADRGGEVARQVEQGLGLSPPIGAARDALAERQDADQVSMRGERDRDHRLQHAWRRDYDGFNAWRDAIEEQGALVLQMTDVPVVEARGFSLAERPLPAVVANIKDSPRARSFTRRLAT